MFQPIPQVNRFGWNLTRSCVGSIYRPRVSQSSPPICQRRISTMVAGQRTSTPIGPNSALVNILDLLDQILHILFLQTGSLNILFPQFFYYFFKFFTLCHSILSDTSSNKKCENFFRKNLPARPLSEIRFANFFRI